MPILKVTKLQTIAGLDRYTAKAWVNVNGTGVVAIRASGNTSSVTDQGVGAYYMNFATTLADGNYSYTHSYSNEINVQHGIGVVQNSFTSATLGVAHFNGANTLNTVDKSYVFITVFNN